MILLATGRLRQGSARDIAGLLKDLVANNPLVVIKGALELVQLIVEGENRYNPDFCGVVLRRVPA